MLPVNETSFLFLCKAVVGLLQDMDGENMSNMVAKMTQYFGEFGLSLELIVVLSVAVFSFILLLVLGIASLFQEKKARCTDTLLQSGFSGRLEKIERNLNELRADVLRSLELVRSELTSLRFTEEREKEVLEEASGEVAESELIDFPESFDADSVEQESAEQAAIVTAPDLPEPLTERLKKTRIGFWGKLKDIFATNSQLNEETLEQLESLMVASDLGVKLANNLTDRIRAELKEGREFDQVALIKRLKDEVTAILNDDLAVGGEINIKSKTDGPTVVLLVGVNGVGKTTTAAKLASIYKGRGAEVLLVAADTYRAAAVEQLKEWGDRIGVSVVAGAENAKPQTVVFDGMQRAIRDKADLVIIDTAGRLHTKSNLMQELQGIKGAITRHQASGPHEVLLVVDGTTGQNAVVQAREFNSAAQLTGLIITKLDGTSRGGTVVAIKNELGIPVRYIGVGEAAYDLRPFEAEAFVEALLTTIDSSKGDLVELSAHARERRKRSNSK